MVDDGALGGESGPPSCVAARVRGVVRGGCRDRERGGDLEAGMVRGDVKGVGGVR